MLDSHDTHDDVRGGRAPWKAAHQLTRQPLGQNRRCGVLIVGAGITVALMAQHLASLGHDVCVIDRERPGLGSTAASTAMLLWEIDKKLTTLTAIYGFEHAARVYRQSLAAGHRPCKYGAAISDSRTFYYARLRTL